MRPWIILLLSMSAVCQAQNAVYGDAFRQSALDAYLGRTPSPSAAAWVADAAEKGKVLKVAGQVEFKSVPVNDATKHLLAFRVRLEGSESIEENPRLAEVISNRRAFLPWAQLLFFDAAGKSVDAAAQPAMALPFAKWHEQQWVFYPPAGAVSMRLVVNPGQKGNALYLADARLTPAPDEGAVNVNPAFSLGPYNYSGWSAFNVPGGAGRLYSTDDGRTVLYTGFSAQTTTFPLREPGTYRICFNATGNERNALAYLVLLDAAGKEVSRITTMISNPGPKAGSTPFREGVSHFVLPKEVVRGYFLVYHSMVRELRLTRIGGEEKYAEVAR